MPDVRIHFEVVLDMTSERRRGRLSSRRFSNRTSSWDEDELVGLVFLLQGDGKARSILAGFLRVHRGHSCRVWISISTQVIFRASSVGPAVNFQIQGISFLSLRECRLYLIHVHEVLDFLLHDFSQFGGSSRLPNFVHSCVFKFCRRGRD